MAFNQGDKFQTIETLRETEGLSSKFVFSFETYTHTPQVLWEFVENLVFKPLKVKTSWNTQAHTHTRLLFFFFSFKEPQMRREVTETGISSTNLKMFHLASGRIKLCLDKCSKNGFLNKKSLCSNCIKCKLSKFRSYLLTSGERDPEDMIRVTGQE